MVKKRYILIVLVLIMCSSCLSYRTEYNRKRFRYNVLRVDSDVPIGFYQIIDTTKLYQKIYFERRYNDEEIVDYRKRFLKFYKKGKVGVFDVFDSLDINSLDPRNAEMGSYAFENNIILIKSYFEHAQGAIFAKQQYEISRKSDTIIMVSKDYIEHYKELNLPKSFLIYKPDW